MSADAEQARENLSRLEGKIHPDGEEDAFAKVQLCAPAVHFLCEIANVLILSACGKTRVLVEQHGNIRAGITTRQELGVAHRAGAQNRSRVRAADAVVVFELAVDVSKGESAAETEAPSLTQGHFDIRANAQAIHLGVQAARAGDGALARDRLLVASDRRVADQGTGSEERPTVRVFGRDRIERYDSLQRIRVSRPYRVRAHCLTIFEVYVQEVSGAFD